MRMHTYTHACTPILMTSVNKIFNPYIITAGQNGTPPRTSCYIPFCLLIWLTAKAIIIAWLDRCVFTILLCMRHLDAHLHFFLIRLHGILFHHILNSLPLHQVKNV